MTSTLERVRKYYQDNKEHLKEAARQNYYENREEKLKYVAEYQRANKEKKAVWSKRYRDTHKDALKLWRQSNKTRLNAVAMKRQKRREASDPTFRLANRLRHRIYMAVREDHKRGSAVRDLGCSVADLKAHIEKQFKHGMSWESWGINGWHLDHIKPLASFDLTDREQFLAAVHYTNLQPLWAYENIIKSDNFYGGAA